MSKKWYGNVCNRINENKMFCEKIEVGTGLTRYDWSDRHAYEVVEVADQKHIKIREYDHKNVGVPMSNDWELVSNESNPIIELVKRGKYWYTVVSITVAEAKAIFEGNNIDDKIWAAHNNFDLPDIIAKGKTKKNYHRWNVSFGVAEYYYDYEF